jgi:hypothetical protein
MGVKAMWVIDPWRGTASFAGPDALLRETTGLLTVPGTPIQIESPPSSPNYSAWKTVPNPDPDDGSHCHRRRI